MKIGIIDIYESGEELYIKCIDGKLINISGEDIEKVKVILNHLESGESIKELKSELVSMEEANEIITFLFQNGVMMKTQNNSSQKNASSIGFYGDDVLFDQLEASLSPLKLTKVNTKSELKGIKFLLVVSSLFENFAQLKDIGLAAYKNNVEVLYSEIAPTSFTIGPLSIPKMYTPSLACYMQTIVTFLYFEYKGKQYQSLGAASRFSKVDALIKAAVEAYQGIEYAISLDDKELLPNEVNLDMIDDFDKHFHFYNKHPAFRLESPILKQALEFDKGDKKIFNRPREAMCNAFSKDELKKTNLPHLIYTDITPIDVRQINCSVARLITPTWSLLTGIHNYPFLGNDLESSEDPFVKLPHPFP